MLAIGLILSLAGRRPYGPVCRAVVILWAVVIAAFSAGIAAAVLFANDFSRRLIVFLLVFLGVLVPFVIRSTTFKALK
ncbi:MAG TPA: hypothetical protein PKE27_00990 [Povalibacter sp.]|nr:hypothetical protein [Povalibacter sp.]